MDVSTPIIVADGYSLRVRLGPVLTRVITAGAVLRGEAFPWLSREIAMSRWLAEHGAAVAPPWAEPGPHEIDGIWVSAWRFVEPLRDLPPTAEDARAGGAAFGRHLFELHEVLMRCPLDLPLLVGPLTDIRTALRRSDHPVLHRAAAQLLPLVQQWPRQPLHGDAHAENLLMTAEGLCWIDFEDACAGPVEWDLSSAKLKPEAIAAYSAPLDARRLAQCRDLRRLQTLASLLCVDGADETEWGPLAADLARRY